MSEKDWASMARSIGVAVGREGPTPLMMASRIDSAGLSSRWCK